MGLRTSCVNPNDEDGRNSDQEGKGSCYWSAAVDWHGVNADLDG